MLQHKDLAGCQILRTSLTPKRWFHCRTSSVVLGLRSFAFFVPQFSGHFFLTSPFADNLLVRLAPLLLLAFKRYTHYFYCVLGAKYTFPSW